MELRIARKYLMVGTLVSLLSFRSPQPASAQQCGGCDPDGSMERDCLDRGWEWDPQACECREPEGCDPQAENDCRNNGGIWNDIECECESCQITTEYTGSYSENESYCVDGWWLNCTTDYDCYQDYCQDGNPVGDEYCVGTGGCQWGDPCDC